MAARKTLPGVAMVVVMLLDARAAAGVLFEGIKNVVGECYVQSPVSCVHASRLVVVPLLAVIILGITSTSLA